MPEARQFIAAMARYRSPIADRLRLNLDLNENAAGCSPDVLAKLQSLSVEDLARYPQRELGEQIVADFLEVSPNNVLLTNGIDEALQVICATYLDQQSQLLLADPTFSMYRVYGQATGAIVSAVTLGEDFLLPIDDFLRAINGRTKLILIANPNNPTGTVVAREDLLCVLQQPKTQQWSLMKPTLSFMARRYWEMSLLFRTCLSRAHFPKLMAWLDYASGR